MPFAQAFNVLKVAGTMQLHPGPALARHPAGRRGDERLVVGPRGGVITTATLRDATGWDTLVAEPASLDWYVTVCATAVTWMADAGVELHILQRVAGHQDPAVTSRYLHPDVQAMLDAGTAFRPGGPNLVQTRQRSARFRVGENPGERRSDQPGCLVIRWSG